MVSFKYSALKKKPRLSFGERLPTEMVSLNIMAAAVLRLSYILTNVFTCYDSLNANRFNCTIKILNKRFNCAHNREFLNGKHFGLYSRSMSNVYLQPKQGRTVSPRQCCLHTSTFTFKSIIPI